MVEQSPELSFCQKELESWIKYTKQKSLDTGSMQHGTVVNEESTVIGPAFCLEVHCRPQSEEELSRFNIYQKGFKRNIICN